MSRNTFLLITVATTLLASTAEARPQASTGGSGRSGRVTVRRCPGCASQRDSLSRARQERLLLKLDSLRWEIDNRHLTETERERASREMTQTVIALQAALDERMRATTVVGGGARIAVEVMPYEAMIAAPAVFTVETFRSRGYLGVTFDGPSAEITRNNEHVIRFYQYPRIALVEPGSPAERAGILEGDTLLALNGADVMRNEISLTKLLIPESRITVRVRREGNAKDVKVTVGETPDYYVRRAPMATIVPMPSGAMRVRRLPPTAAVAPMPPMPPMPSMPPMPETPVPARMWAYSEGVAGARVETISEGLGKAVGVKEGVLVIRAAPGTPAYRSGLRDGDIIIEAAGKSVIAVRDLRRAMIEGEGDGGVKLVILRERKQRDVTLRW